jgi:hypothetical protein
LPLPSLSLSPLLSARLAFKPRHPERSEGPLFAVAVAVALAVAVAIAVALRVMASAMTQKPALRAAP